ncbi:DEAD/DEAH box helicase [Pontiella sulfatireligans]|uniref:DEAD-box ATP-dependent RNA helicase CshA n=1 Tax=Pontiella sulfatireligans TaxID=2750658 RepID=A0A6C2UVB9_9BACT|nr:DEAD/DEAH box helicase [Pontiella sulfatireligans]VGO23341.1 DEAD-box ATP-dependent RNA helicase CshA [Pontiella sulfatireligans]
MNTFKELGIAEGYIKGLAELGIQIPTDIQAKTIPMLLGKTTDFVGQAQTGTGKTAAFGLPLLASVDPTYPKIQGVVLAPTRELAKQVQKQLFKFTKYTEQIFSEVVCGGDKIDRQIEALKRPTQILVATPGRLMDLIRRKAVDLSHVKTLVLDEADEMLKLGFRDDIDSIMTMTRGSRHIWLFSATMPLGIKKMIHKHLAADAPVLKIDKKNIVNPNIRNEYIRCKEGEKLERIVGFLKARGEQRGLIFCRTRADTIAFGEALEPYGFSNVVLHGDLMQTERDKVMRMFKKGRARILITTDVAARGIDVEGLSFVIHHQLPEKNEYYTHRSGRTARAGKTGISLALITHHEEKQLVRLERELGITFREIA